MLLLSIVPFALCFFRRHPHFQHSVKRFNEGLFGRNEYFDEDDSESSCHWLPVHDKVTVVPTHNINHKHSASGDGLLTKHLNGSSMDGDYEKLISSRYRSITDSNGKGHILR